MKRVHGMGVKALAKPNQTKVETKPAKNYVS